jgi:hypothetical protein
MPGQPQKGSNPILGIDCTDFRVADPNDPLGPSNLIIPAGTQFDVSLKFDLDGLLAGWLVSTVVSYAVHYYYESIGAGPEGQLGVVNRNTSAGKLVYDNADTRATVSINDRGVYRLTGVVIFGGAPVTAFTEGPMIQIN